MTGHAIRADRDADGIVTITLDEPGRPVNTFTRAIGFPAWTGGIGQFVDQYEGGARGFVARCRELAGRYGSRFTPLPSLVALAERGEPFRPRRRT